MLILHSLLGKIVSGMQLPKAVLTVPSRLVCLLCYFTMPCTKGRGTSRVNCSCPWQFQNFKLTTWTDLQVVPSGKRRAYFYRGYVKESNISLFCLCLVYSLHSLWKFCRHVSDVFLSYTTPKKLVLPKAQKRHLFIWQVHILSILCGGVKLITLHYIIKHL